MTPNMIHLKIQDLISKRNWITAYANYELHHFGSWQTNWAIIEDEIELDLVDLFTKAAQAGEANDA